MSDLRDPELHACAVGVANPEDTDHAATDSGTLVRDGSSLALRLNADFEKLAAQPPAFASMLGAFAVTRLFDLIPGVRAALAELMALGCVAAPTAETLLIDATGCVPACVAARVCRETLAVSVAQGVIWDGSEAEA